MQFPKNRGRFGLRAWIFRYRDFVVQDLLVKKHDPLRRPCIAWLTATCASPRDQRESICISEWA